MSCFIASIIHCRQIWLRHRSLNLFSYLSIFCLFIYFFAFVVQNRSLGGSCKRFYKTRSRELVNSVQLKATTSLICKAFLYINVSCLQNKAEKHRKVHCSNAIINSGIQKEWSREQSIYVMIIKLCLVSLCICIWIKVWNSIFQKTYSSDKWI